MRKLEELYQLVINEINSKNTNEYICNNINYLCKSGVISEDEYDFLIEDFNNNKPTEEKYEDFYKDSKFIKLPTISSQWWYPGKEVRILFLEMLIKLTKDES